MAEFTVRTLVRQLAHAASRQGVSPESDPDLLRRFAQHRDEAAFTVLLARHGAMVFDVCRHTLGQHPDAEDAFQATFLLLARSAGTIRQPASLAAWLHGVAYRTSLKARTRLAIQREREHQIQQENVTEPACLEAAEVRHIVHEGLAGLSERYRSVLLLCDLQGFTQHRAAEALGLSHAALKKRLQRGRSMLRVALTRRGLAPATTLAMLPIAVPPALAASTSTAAVAFAAHPGTALVSISIRQLITEGPSMFSGKLSAICCLLPVLVVGMVFAGPGSPAERPAAATRTQDGKTEALRAPNPLLGTWKVKHIETRGEPLFTADELKNARITFGEGRAQVDGFRVLYLRDFSFKLDTSLKPAQIDVVFPRNDAYREQKVEGIYVLRQDELRICLRMTNPEHGRPKGFVTNGGSTLYTFILERTKEAAPEPAAPKPVRQTKRDIPAITVEELASGLRKDGFQWTPIGKQMTFRCLVIRAGASPTVQIEGMKKDSMDTAVLHNMLSDNTLKVGDTLDVTGLIVDQWYGVWQIWEYSTKVIRK